MPMLAELLLFHRATELKSVHYHYTAKLKTVLLAEEDGLEQHDRGAFVIIQILVHTVAVYHMEICESSLNLFLLSVSHRPQSVKISFCLYSCM